MHLVGSGIVTVGAGSIPRLMPGDEITVEVLVTPSGNGAASFDNVHVELKGQRGQFWRRRLAHGVEGCALVTDWEAWTEERVDLEQHSAPQWYRGAKFGVGVVASPLALANSLRRSSFTGAYTRSPLGQTRTSTQSGTTGGCILRVRRVEVGTRISTLQPPAMKLTETL